MWITAARRALVVPNLFHMLGQTNIESIERLSDAVQAREKADDIRAAALMIV
jgi:hypothetical protein